MAKYQVTLANGAIVDVTADEMSIHGIGSIQFNNITMRDHPNQRDSFGGNRQYEQRETIAIFNQVNNAIKVE